MEPVSTAGTTVPFQSTAAPLDEGTGIDQIIYTAISADESAVSYSLKANNTDDADHFTINATTGEVKPAITRVTQYSKATALRLLQKMRREISRKKPSRWPLKMQPHHRLQPVQPRHPLKKTAERGKSSTQQQQLMNHK